MNNQDQLELAKLRASSTGDLKGLKKLIKSFYKLLDPSLGVEDPDEL